MTDTTRITIAVEKPGLSSGTVLLEEVAYLTQGLADTIVGLVHHHLGYSVRSQPHDEAKRLAVIALSEVSKNGQLSCDVLPIAGISGEQPGAVAVADLIRGIRTFIETQHWPAFLPAPVRHHLAEAMAPVLTEATAVRLSLRSNGHETSCIIDRRMRESLQVTETVSAAEAVEEQRSESTAALRLARERARELEQLEDGWDSYGARKPDRAVIEFALSFLRDALSVLLDYGLVPPVPLLVATPLGGVQLEWTVEDRELELEIDGPGRFRYLQVDGETEAEGDASRWQAIRLLYWVTTGETA